MAQNSERQPPTKRPRKAADIPPPPPPPQGVRFAYSHTVEDWDGRTAVLHVDEAVSRNPTWRNGLLEGLDAWVRAIAPWLEQHGVDKYWLSAKDEDESLVGGPMPFPMVTLNHRLFSEDPFIFVPFGGSRSSIRPKSD